MNDTAQILANDRKARVLFFKKKSANTYQEHGFAHLLALPFYI